MLPTAESIPAKEIALELAVRVLDSDRIHLVAHANGQLEPGPLTSTRSALLDSSPRQLLLRVAREVAELAIARRKAATGTCDIAEDDRMQVEALALDLLHGHVDHDEFWARTRLAYL